jgi:hypothetical protein
VSGTHSLLAPSDAERWSRCVGALHHSRGEPDVDKEYNASGTCSHYLGAWALENPQLDLDSWLGKQLKFGAFEFTIDAERLERVATYVRNVQREPGQLWVEKRINTSPVLGLPNQEGHADAVKLDLMGQVEISGALHRGVLSVHDFKDGYIRVDARDNLQGVLYLAGALYEYDLLADIGALRFCIHQPKIRHYDEWTYTRAEIERYLDVIRPVAKLAYDIYYGKVPFDPAIHLNPGEEQCQWCPVRGSCTARAARIAAMFAPLVNRHALDDDTLSAIYLRLDEIEGAVRDFRIEAYKRAIAGHTIKGHKLVYGNKGPRGWKKDTLPAIETALREKLPEEKVFQPRELISPTQANKLIKGDGFKPFAEYITQSEASLKLVPESAPGDPVEVPKFGVVPQTESLI